MTGLPLSRHIGIPDAGNILMMPGSILCYFSRRQPSWSGIMAHSDVQDRLGRVLDLLVPAAGIGASVAAALSMGQSADWDQRNYHYYAGYALLHKPLLYDFAPAQVQSFFNPLFHVPSYLLLAHLPTRATAAILAALQGMNIWLIYRISKKLFAGIGSAPCTILSIACAAAAFYGAANLAELGTTFGDNLISLFPLAAVLLLVDHVGIGAAQGRRGRWRMGAAGGLVGLACGLKLTTAIYAVSLAVMLGLLAVLARIRVRDAARFVVAAAIGFALTYGYWGLALEREFGNPVFPYLNNVFRSEMYPHENTMDARFLPRDWSQRLFYPFYFVRENTLVSELPFRDWRFAACYVLVAALAITRAMRAFGRRKTEDPDAGSQSSGACLFLLAGFMVFSYVLWQGLFSIYRYAAALEFLAPVFIVSALLYLIRRRVVAVAVSLALLGMICRQMSPMDFGRVPFGDAMLKVSPPPWPGLARSLVIMGGEEATAYIVPSFPATTRFVRIQANWLYPGLNANLDRRIASLLRGYAPDRRLVYLSSKGEMAVVAPALAYFGLGVDADSCAPLGAAWGDAGYLCRASPSP